jgi:hypothetical protein
MSGFCQNETASPQQAMQYTCKVSSPQEAEMIADGLRQLEGCIDARSYIWSTTAHFEIDQAIPPEALPDGCRLVPTSVVAFLQRRNNGDGVVKKLSVNGDLPASDGA